MKIILILESSSEDGDYSDIDQSSIEEAAVSIDSESIFGEVSVDETSSSIGKFCVCCSYSLYMQFLVHGCISLSFYESIIDLQLICRL